MYSYIHTQRKSKSRIDRVYVNDENTNKITYYKHTPTPFNLTHRIVSFTMKNINERGPGYWKMNTSIIKDPPFQIVVENTCEDVQRLNIEDPIEKWQVFIETIRLETQIYCSKKRYYENRIKNNCERNIEILEKEMSVNNNPDLQKEYHYNLNKLNKEKKQLTKQNLGPR